MRSLREGALRTACSAPPAQVRDSVHTFTNSRASFFFLISRISAVYTQDIKGAISICLAVTKKHKCSKFNVILKICVEFWEREREGRTFVERKGRRRTHKRTVGHRLNWAWTRAPANEGDGRRRRTVGGWWEETGGKEAAANMRGKVVEHGKGRWKRWNGDGAEVADDGVHHLFLFHPLCIEFFQ